METKSAINAYQFQCYLSDYLGYTECDLFDY